MKNITNFINKKVSRLQGKIQQHLVSIETTEKLERLDTKGDYGKQTTPPSFSSSRQDKPYLKVKKTDRKEENSLHMKNRIILIQNLQKSQIPFDTNDRVSLQSLLQETFGFKKGEYNKWDLYTKEGSKEFVAVYPNGHIIIGQNHGSHYLYHDLKVLSKVTQSTGFYRFLKATKLFPDVTDALQANNLSIQAEGYLNLKAKRQLYLKLKGRDDSHF